MTHEVYVLRDDHNVIKYVGVAKNAKDRLRRHWAKRNENLSPSALWMRTLSDKPTYEVVEVVEDDEADNAERYWILYLHLVGGVKLLNVTYGGVNYRRMTRRASPSAETMEKLRKASTGVKRSPETRQRMSEAAKARWARERVKRNMGTLDDVVHGTSNGGKD